MRRTVLILGMILCGYLSFGQDSAAISYKKQYQTQYQAFKDSLDKQYKAFLNQYWLDYDMFLGEHRNHAPEPNLQPQSDTLDENFESLLSHPVLTPLTVPLSDSIRVDASAVYKAEIFNFDFYCRKVSISIPIRVSSLALNGIHENNVFRFWKQLRNENMNMVAVQLLQQKQSMYLNDWGLFDLTQQLCGKIYPHDEATRNAMTVYLMNLMQYDIRLGRMGGRLCVLVTSNSRLYECPFIEMDGKRYYAVTLEQKDMKTFSKLRTYARQLPSATKPLDLYLHYSPRIGGCLTSTPYRAIFEGVKMQIPVNKALVSFMANYPQTELPVYATAAVEEAMGLEIENNLRPLVVSKSTVESVASLLGYVQNGFRYQSDMDQFGKERTLFCEENFYYQSNDCEDRAILFAFLVRRLMQLDVVLLEFKDHVATAVCFGKEKIKGNYYQYQGKKYVVCDPTTQGAKVGQLTRKYRHQTPNMIIINN